MSEAYLIIFESENGRDGWRPLLPVEVPEWVKDPDVLGTLLNGQIAMDPTKSTNWYRAERAPTQADVERIFAAQRRQALRAAKRVTH
jgi:hypothetical protein